VLLENKLILIHFNFRNRDDQVFEVRRDVVHVSSLFVVERARGKWGMSAIVTSAPTPDNVKLMLANWAAQHITVTIKISHVPLSVVDPILM
jgi:hypothetical protein